MTQCVLISHGEVAAAIRHAAFEILGERDNVHAISVGAGDGPVGLEAALTALLAPYAGEPMVLICDIVGGTPVNVALKMWLRNREHAAVLTGLNLPMVLAFMQESETSLSPESLLQAGRDGITDISARARSLSAS